MGLTFSVRHFLQNLVGNNYKLYTIYIYNIYIYTHGPILLKSYLRLNTGPCQSLDIIVCVNIEIVAEQIWFSAMKTTSHNTIN